MATWTIDPAHTDISFSAKHMMITTVRGKFSEVEGELDLDEQHPERSGGRVRARAASLSTGFEARDAHLRSADFFDAENHEWIEFVATRVEPKGGDDFVVTGSVTIRGVTRPISFEVEYLGTTPGMTGARHAGFTARTRISRKEWGLNWNMALESGGWLVGDEIKLEIDVAADEVAVPAAADAALGAESAA